MEIGLRFFGFIQTMVRLMMQPLYFMWSLQRVKKLPPIKDPILLQSASKLARRIRSGQVKSEDVIRAYIARVQEVNPYVNAVVEERYSDALQEARAVDDLIASRTKTEQEIEKQTPLLGVPLTVKESCGVKGMSHCVGSRTRLGIKADNDAGPVKLARKAGAIPLLVSNTPEFCLCWETNNLVTGRTRNPYNPLRTSGGSSGGEAALIGSGASVVGIGSDVAGSIRLPAMYNGIFGHKPTPGYVPIDGHFPYATDVEFPEYLAIGPITRYAEDLKPMLSVMAGDHASKLKLDEKVDLRTLKLFYMTEAGYSLVMVPVERDVKDAIHIVAKHLNKKYGIPVKKGNFKEMENSAESSVAIFFALQGVPYALEDPQNPKKSHNLYLEIVKSIFGLSKFSFALLMFYLLQVVNVFIPRRNRQYYCKENAALKKKFTDILGDNGIFLYPTHPTAAYYHNEVYTKTAGVMYSMIFNILGLPSTHVPLGLNKEGLPIGVQIVAGPHQDRLCIAIAEALERDFGGWIPPPSGSQNHATAVK